MSCLRWNSNPRHSTLTDLSLAQGYGVEFLGTEALILGKFEQPGHGVGPGREDKQQRNATVGVCVALGQVKGRGVDEFLTQILADKLCH